MQCSGNSTWEILRGVGDLRNENQFVFFAICVSTNEFLHCLKVILHY